MNPPLPAEPEPQPRTTEPFDAMLQSMLSGVRVIPDAQACAEDVRRRAQSMQARANTLRALSGAPERHSSAIADKSGIWGEKLASIEATLGDGRLWALTGSRGNGKTQLAVEVMRTATGRGMSARYTSAIRFFSEVKATYRRDAEETEIEILDRHRKPKILVVDEIGKRGETEWEANLLFELINNRYGDMTDTILIANLSVADLAASLGPSISGRLNETGGVIHCDWPSRR